MISDERIEEMRFWYNRETNDEETQEWRDDLTPDECNLNEEWDTRYFNGIKKICDDIEDLFFENKTSFSKGEIIKSLKNVSLSTKNIVNAYVLQGKVAIEYTNGSLVILDQDLNLIEVFE